jgi:hypothetical protein
MRILDQNSNLSLNNILILLTNNEAIVLKEDLERIISLSSNKEHIHIDDKEYKHEITLSLYNEKENNYYNERMKKLIFEDK